MSKLITIALSQYGVTEIPGTQHNKTIVNYAKEIGHTEINDDETAWCSIFANWVAMNAGYERSNKLNARSWLNVGTKTNEPVLGDIVVFWRDTPESWKGHVAFYIKEDKDKVWVLGGNQSNSVSITTYPKSRVLSYQKLKQI